MKRTAVILAARTFDRTAIRLIVRETLPDYDIVECGDAAGFRQNVKAHPGLIAIYGADMAAQVGEVVSGLGKRALAVTLAAPGDLGRMANELPARLRAAQTALAQPLAPPPAPLAAAPAFVAPDLILVAASTGGPTALAAFLAALGPDHKPLIVAQHMPRDGTRALADHLSRELERPVRAVGPGAVEEGVALLEGGGDYQLTAAGAGWRLREAPPGDSPFHPNADRLFLSAAAERIAALAIVLSGMGEDGARGAAALEANGAAVYVQAPMSCVVAGMPNAARAACRSAHPFDPAEPPESLRRLCARRGR